MKLYGYQNRCVKRLLKKLSTMIWLKPGGGKTLIILTWLHILKVVKRERVAALIVGTELIITDTWPDEITGSQKFHHLKYDWLHGADMQYAVDKVLADDFDIMFTTPDTLVTLIETKPKLFKHFRQLIIDESTKYKGPTSVRWKKLKSMLKKNPQISQRVCMTGTPAPNGWLQLFTQFWLVGMTKVFNTDSYYDYRDWYFYTKPRKDYDWLMLPGADKKIARRISPYIFQPRKEEYREMPDIVEFEYKITLPEKIIKLHNAMDKKRIITIGEHEVLAANAGVATFKCAQIASGAVYKYTDPLNPAAGRYTIPLHNCKTDALEEVLDDVGQANTLVLYSYNHDRDRIIKRFPYARDISKDRNAIRDWKKGRVPMLLGHPASMAHGLNLQFGGNILVWYSTTPDAEYWEQAIKRLHRGEISEPVYVYYLISKGTKDERFMQIVRKKVADQDELMERFSGLH